MSLDPIIFETSTDNGFLYPFDKIDPNDFNAMWIEDIKNDKAFIHSIIKNDEAKTNKIYSYKYINGYHIFNHIPPERIHPGRENWEVEYSFNEDLFRSEHFQKNHDGLHILFGGCSNTEAVGSNIEHNWSYLLYKEISEKTQTSGFFSIAKGGYGWHQIFLNFKIYVQRYGAPDYYFVLHPNILRYYQWRTEEKRWRYIQRNREDMSAKEWLEDHHSVFPDWVAAMSMFTAYCDSVGTKLLWTTWDEIENKNIENSKFFENNFFKNYVLNQENIKLMRPNGKTSQEDSSFRDGHPGRIAQELWAKAFKDELIKKNWIF